MNSTFDDKVTKPDDSVTSQKTRTRKTPHISDTPNTRVYYNSKNIHSLFP